MKSVLYRVQYPGTTVYRVRVCSAPWIRHVMGLCASAAPVAPVGPAKAKNYYAQQAAQKAEQRSREWASWDSHRGLDAHVVHGFAIATATSTKPGARDAVLEAYRVMDKRLALPMRGEKGATVMHNVTADILFVFVSPEYSVAAVSDALAECAANVPIHGSSSAQGVFSWEGLHLATSPDNGTTTGGITIMGIADDEGAYATNVQGFGDHQSVEAAATIAATTCQSKLNIGADLSAVFVNSSAGTSDRVMKAVRSVVGENVPLVGGSSGVGSDGTSSQFTALDCFTEGGVVVTLMTSTASVESRIIQPYEENVAPNNADGTASKRGMATEVELMMPASGASVCVLHKIDGKRASDVFASWCDGSVGENMIWREGKEGNVRALTASHPMRVTAAGAVESHIVECIRKNGDGSLVVSGAIAEGSVLASQRHVNPSDGDDIARQNTLQTMAAALSEVTTAGALIVFSDEYRRFTTDALKRIRVYMKDSNLPFCGMFAAQQISSTKSDGDSANSLSIQITLFKKNEK